MKLRTVLYHLKLWLALVLGGVIFFNPTQLAPTLYTKMEEQTDMSIDKDQLRKLITGVLKDINHVIPYSDSATELLMLTAATESNLGTYIMQVGGPARGIFQMEPATEKDIIENYAKYKPEYMAIINKYKSVDTEYNLTGNIPYQIVMSRLLYRRSKRALPVTPDPALLAQLWKDVYNTRLGKGVVEVAIEKYGRYC
jgi:hypothetical protein